MSRVHGSADRLPDTETRAFAAARKGNEHAFTALVERHRGELHLHCYRMVGSLQDAEDLVQETFLRAWSKRASFAGRSSFRAWLYGIATNACLDALRRRPKRVLPFDVVGPSDPRREPEPPASVAWLEPYPDRLLDEVEASGVEPEALLISREATELAFLVAVQHLPPRQRAVLILRDVLDWSAMETAASLGTTVASVNSALQRAHATVANHLPARQASVRASAISERERTLLEGLIDAWQRADATALASLLREDARLVMPPTVSWYEGRDAIKTFFVEHAFTPGSPPRTRLAVATTANRQPAMAVYTSRPGEAEREAFALVVLRVDGDAISELTLFRLPELFAAWGLPAAI